MALLDFLNPLSAITGALERAYVAKLNAKNDEERIAADVEIGALEARRDAVIASGGDPWWSPRTIMGWCAAIVVAKLLVWDTVLGWGVTPDPGDTVTWIVMTIVGFYFLSRSAEAIAGALAGRIGRR